MSEKDKVVFKIRSDIPGKVSGIIYSDASWKDCIVL